MTRAKFGLVLLIVGLCMLLSVAVQAERSFSFPDLVISIDVAADGSFTVVEKRTVEFKGRYTGMFQWINLQGDMQVSDVTVAEDGRTYSYNHAHDIGPAGTFYSERQGNRQYIDWSFEASDEVRTFTISYKVNNAIRVHNDVAEFYYQFVGKEWEAPVGRVFVGVHLPAGAAREQLRAWGHGPLHGNVQIVDDRTVQWQVTRLPAKTMLEGRIAFPPELVPYAGVHTGESGLDNILREEEGWAAQANRRRQYAQFDWKLAIALVVAGIIGAIVFWAKYGKEYTPDFDGDYYRELPGNYSPAELGVLWSMGYVRDRDLSATLLDLARRKFVKLEECQSEASGLFRTRMKDDYRIVRLDNSETLASHEQRLMDFLFTDTGYGDQITLGQLEGYAKRHKRSFARFWRNWQKDVQKLAEKHKFFDTAVTARAQAIGVVVGIVVMLSSIAAFIYSLHFSGVGLLVAGITLLLTAASTKRRSRSGANDFARWKAFQRFLKHFSEIPRQEVPALVIWEHYLVYAVTLGVAKEVLKQLEIVFPNLEDGSYHFGHGWYYHSGIHRVALQEGLSGLTSSVQNTFTQSIQIATSQSSSGSGSGGGFSGGGGGGFGGGGGGAR